MSIDFELFIKYTVFVQELLESYLIDFNALESKIDLTRNQIQNAEELVCINTIYFLTIFKTNDANMFISDLNEYSYRFAWTHHATNSLSPIPFSPSCLAALVSGPM